MARKIIFTFMQVHLRVILIVCFILTAYIPAYAEVKTFDLFSINLPNSWTTEERNGSLRFTSSDELCVFDILIAPHFDIAYRELAISFYQNLSGANASNDDGGMSFDVTADEHVQSKARITLQGDNFAVITASGQCFEYQDILQSITLLNVNVSETEQASDMVNTGARIYPILTETD